MSVKSYLLSLPERILRSTVGVGAGVVREVGEAILPKEVRRSRLYTNLVDVTLRYLIEEVGGAQGVYPTDERLGQDFLIRRTAGNALELFGIVAFRASPVWVLAALADVCGIGRHLIPEIADALKAHGLLEKDRGFASVDQLLDGLERTSSRLAATVNTPPLDVSSLRQEWQEIRQSLASIPTASLPSREAVRALWAELTTEAARQKRSVFEVSSTLALAAVSKLPDSVRWFSASATLATTRTGQVFAAALLEHYRHTLGQIRETGFADYAVQQFRPYIRAAVSQFAPNRRTLTERLIDKFSLPNPNP